MKTFFIFNIFSFGLIISSQNSLILSIHINKKERWKTSIDNLNLGFKFPIPVLAFLKVHFQHRLTIRRYCFLRNKTVSVSYRLSERFQR